MQEDPEERKIADKILKSIKDTYGSVPIVNQVLSERPDLFIPMANVGKAVLEGKGEMERKNRFLAALSAASALGGEHCVRVQIDHAKQAGASNDEILEAIMIGSYMAMTRSQSYALREYRDMSEKK